MFSVLSFTGFEASAIYGEEAKAGRSDIRRATYLSLTLLVLIYGLSTWSLVAAFDDVRAAAAQDPSGLVFAAAAEYLGPGSVPVVSGLVVVSFFACALALHNMGTRYLFATARAGLVPARLASVHTRYGSPHVAAYVQAAFVVAVFAPFVVAGIDPFTVVLPAASGITSLSTIALMAACCVSVIVARVRGLVRAGTFESVVAPAIALAGLLATFVVIVANYSDITGSSSPVVAAVPLIPLVVLVYGVLRHRSGARSEALAP